MHTSIASALLRGAKNTFKKSVRFTLLIPALFIATAAYAVPFEFDDGSGKYLGGSGSLKNDIWNVVWACTDSSSVTNSCQLDAVMDISFDLASLSSFDKNAKSPLVATYLSPEQQAINSNILAAINFRNGDSDLWRYSASGEGAFTSAVAYAPVTSVPEPGTLVLLGMGLIALGLFRLGR